MLIAFSMLLGLSVLLLMAWFRHVELNLRKFNEQLLAEQQRQDSE